jgi:acyl-CoA dehydrogenase
LESFGGAGYVEDTGLPVLLRDSQVLSIWEGTTNVLALDVLRALADGGAHPALQERLAQCARSVREPGLQQLMHKAGEAISHAASWLDSTQSLGRLNLEAGARRFALTLGRALALSLLAEHAQWALDQEGDALPLAAARRFAQQGVDYLIPVDPAEAYALANDLPLESETHS